MANGKAFMEELREIISNEEKSIPTKQMNRLIITGIVELYDLNANTVVEIKKLQEEVPKKWLMKNWKTLLFTATAFFLIVHSLVPADVSLWSFFIKLIGAG